MTRGSVSSAMKKAHESRGTDRSLEEYKKSLRFTDGDLKRWAAMGWIMDLGSGDSQQFVQEARKLLGEDVPNVPVDPSLASPGEVEYRREKKRREFPDTNEWQPQPNTIAALIQEKFLAENSVAVILALWSVPEHLDPKKPKELEAALNNIALALMPGGEFRAYPVAPSLRDDIKEIFAPFPNLTVEFPEEAGGELLIVRKHISSN